MTVGKRRGVGEEARVVWIAERALLVLPAASSPSMSRRISLEPKSLPIILET